MDMELFIGKKHSHLILDSLSCNRYYVSHSQKQSVVEFETTFPCLQVHSHSISFLYLRKLHVDYQSCANICRNSYKSIGLILDCLVLSF